MKFRGDRGRYGAERFGFLSNRKLTDLRFTPARHGLFGIYRASLRLDDQEVQLINVHLSPFVIPRNATAAQAMTALARVEGVHQQETQQLVGLIDRNTPTLVCGDFNSLSTFTAPERLTQLSFTDSFASVTEQPDLTPTWRWPVGRLKIQFRIDYIFHSPHFRTTDSQVINTTGSDHSLVVSELQLSPPGM
jgi:endonuclease/exonuclease/phosphatase family metal-dependent hydrolase